MIVDTGRHEPLQMFSTTTKIHLNACSLLVILDVCRGASHSSGSFHGTLAKPRRRGFVSLCTLSNHEVFTKATWGDLFLRSPCQRKCPALAFLRSQPELIL
jgi:hypothetical protein